MEVSWKYAPRRGESVISEICQWAKTSKCARRQGESTISENALLCHKLSTLQNMHGVEARAPFSNRVLCLRSRNMRGVEARALFLNPPSYTKNSQHSEICTASRREPRFWRRSFRNMHGAGARARFLIALNQHKYIIISKCARRSGESTIFEVSWEASIMTEPGFRPVFSGRRKAQTP